MKKKFIYLWTLLALVAGMGCSDDDLDSRSIFDTDTVQRNAFDEWLVSNYTYPYNIDLKYRMEDIETDMKYHLAPAELDKSIKLAKLVKYLWLEVYDEVAGIDFTRTLVPRTIHFIGSPAYENNGTMILGTAEGGLKVTLYMVNELQLNMAFLNYYYFKTMHHEFGHILHQKKNYPPAFKLISEAEYVGGDWYQQDDYAEKGFVSQYAMNEADDDFVENIAIFVTNTPETWEELLEEAGPGKAIILQKFEIVKDYMKDTWKIDIEQLRDVILRRAGDIDKIDLGKL